MASEKKMKSKEISERIARNKKRFKEIELENQGYKAKKKFPDLTGDGKVTFADVLKGRGVINGKNKKKVI